MDHVANALVRADGGRVENKNGHLSIQTLLHSASSVQKLHREPLNFKTHQQLTISRTESLVCIVVSRRCSSFFVYTFK